MWLALDIQCGWIYELGSVAPRSQHLSEESEQLTFRLAGDFFTRFRDNLLLVSFTRIEENLIACYRFPSIMVVLRPRFTASSEKGSPRDGIRPRFTASSEKGSPRDGIRPRFTACSEKGSARDGIRPRFTACSEKGSARDGRNGKCQRELDSLCDESYLLA